MISGRGRRNGCDLSPDLALCKRTTNSQCDAKLNDCINTPTEQLHLFCHVLRSVNKLGRFRGTWRRVRGRGRSL